MVVNIVGVVVKTAIFLHHYAMDLINFYIFELVFIYFEIKKLYVVCELLFELATVVYLKFKSSAKVGGRI